MAKNKVYTTTQKNKKNSKTLQGGYLSSLTGISQTERNTLSKETYRGTGAHENKKRKDLLKRNRKYTNNYDGYYAV